MGNVKTGLTGGSSRSKVHRECSIDAAAASLRGQKLICTNDCRSFRFNYDLYVRESEWTCLFGRLRKIGTTNNRLEKISVRCLRRAAFRHLVDKSKFNCPVQNLKKDIAHSFRESEESVVRAVFSVIMAQNGGNGECVKANCDRACSENRTSDNLSRPVQARLAG